MRILFANDGIGDAGGVQTYLAAVMPALASRGHDVALLHLDPVRGGEGTPAPAGAPHFCMAERGMDGALADMRAWAPDVAFSHNMRPLEVDRALIAAGPAVKMMHGYFGTCIGGQKAHLFPRPEPCGRVFGPACLALYLPRRNGRMSLPYVAEQWRWASEQKSLFGAYSAVVTASGHMRREYVRNGVAAERAHAIPLFSTIGVDGDAGAPADFRALFLGRMTRLKGGDVLIRAAARAAEIAGRPIPLTMCGDGPQRGEWEALARDLGVPADFPGWVDADARLRLFRAASVLAVPSVWPEPFGLVGLEAGSQGVPAIAFDVGGIGEWLKDGDNGRLVPGDPPRVESLADALAWAATHPAELAAMRPRALDAARRMSLAAHVDALERVLADAARAGASRAPVDAAGSA
ncbi:glycosyltransferase family 4 protein [Longimicrobium sp.]|uniref:glycosyltransferase family 4 protein n=1 Tax=Longimicrobium sp. TaxID=2029185 RepID=UPI002B56F495|nr:glycosyltransferase family 4 protein [Longimicrobium sp.]HSU15216.1 glycosyltransferase family 4 protein [Longimicrobium sp.]